MLWGNQSSQSRRASFDSRGDTDRVRAERADAAAASFTSSASRPKPGITRATLSDFENSSRQSNVAQIQRQLQQAADRGSQDATQLQQGIMRKRHSFARDTGPNSITSAHLTGKERHDAITGLLAAKETTGKSFTELGQELGLTNTYTAQLFYNQAQLQPGRVGPLRRAVPALTDQQLAFMQRSPLRTPDVEAQQDASHRVLQEALAHHAAAIKAIMNENWGDVVLNPADVAADVSLTPGKNGESRFTLTLSGKYTPFIEQESFVPNGNVQSNGNGRISRSPRDRMPSTPEE